MAGQQLFKFDNALDSLSLGIELLPDKNIIISINTDGDKRTYYTVIDALKGMVVLRFEISTLKEAGFWEGKAFTIYNNRIYFITKELSTSFYCGVGIFNINTSKLEWVEKVNLKKGFLKEAPQTDGKRVYVLDSTGILHIYEIKKTSLAFVGM